ncbi:hypothetical protein ElyMa_002352200 [Elysia marginata]|uniref:Immunoglobulin subtype domain-containing protein n=1 Tax=Elysia marginata TaxID=1093978 RepID=A0AAV4G9U5_9GAST|nr:hypothetical protein ElyMa_002352200 [Elysia marginata]
MSIYQVCTVFVQQKDNGLNPGRVARASQGQGESNNPGALSPVTVEPDPLMTRTLNRECDPVEFRSHLSLQLTEEDNGRMYICSARDGNEPEYRANETLSISAAVVEPPNGGGNPAPATSGGNDAGMIVGIVVGVLAFIVIVLLLVYFCWYRKRNDSPKGKQQSTRKEGHAFVAPCLHLHAYPFHRRGGWPFGNRRPLCFDTKPDMHTPPPVFYSKPNKPPKDERDDGTWGKIASEASDTWGRKPRYDTYDDEQDRRDDNNRRKPSSSSTGGRRGRQGSASSAVRDRDGYPSRSAYDEDDNNGYGPDSKNDSYDSYSRPRYEKRKSKEALNSQAPANTTTEVSGRSEDEASDAPLSGSYGQKPRPKRRTSRPSSASEDRDDRRGTYRRGDREREREREGERQGDPALHYAQLDLAPSSERERERGRRGGRRDQPVEYAEIRV